MGTPLQFDYYYGAEAEQFRFFRIPKMLFEKNYFKPLSCESKLLYGVLLDQVSLSLKNGWVDEQNRTYIIFTVESVTDTIGCSRDKARKLMMELEEIGLIEKKRRGQGRPDIIYVKNFVRLIAEKPSSENNRKEVDNFSEGEKTGFQKAENQFSRRRNFRLLEDEKSVPNNTNINNTESSDTHSFHSRTLLPDHDAGISGQDRREEGTAGKQYAEQESVKTAWANENRRNEKENIGDKGRIPDIRVKEAYMEILKEQVRYDALVSEESYRYDRELIDGILNTIADIAAFPGGTEWIAGTDLPREVVKGQLLKLDYDTLTYAVDCLKKNSTRITHKRAYLLTTLYRAPDIMNFGIMSDVQYDMYGGGWEEKGIIGGQKNG